MTYYVVWTGAAWFAKAQTFFEQQVRETKPGDDWFKHWRLVYGAEGPEHAKLLAERRWGPKGERWKSG